MAMPMLTCNVVVSAGSAASPENCSLAVSALIAALAKDVANIAVEQTKRNARDRDSRTPSLL